MFNDRGYVDDQPGTRSPEAIERFQIPLNHFNSETFIDFQCTYGDDFEDKIFEHSMGLWRYVATNRIGKSPQRYNEKCSNPIDHYDLYEVARYIQNHIDTIPRDYRRYHKKARERRKQLGGREQVGWLAARIWGGTQQHPKPVEDITAIGYVHPTNKATWLVSTDDCQYNINSNRVKEIHLFNDLTSFKKFVGERIDLRRFEKWLREQGKHVAKK